MYGDKKQTRMVLNERRTADEERRIKDGKERNDRKIQRQDTKTNAIK